MSCFGVLGFYSTWMQYPNWVLHTQTYSPVNNCFSERRILLKALEFGDFGQGWKLHRCVDITDLIVVVADFLAGITDAFLPA